MCALDVLVLLVKIREVALLMEADIILFLESFLCETDLLCQHHEVEGQETGPVFLFREHTTDCSSGGIIIRT